MKTKNWRKDQLVGATQKLSTEIIGGIVGHINGRGRRMAVHGRHHVLGVPSVDERDIAIWNG